MDDVTDFPQQKIIPLMESRNYEEGKYRPPSMPAIGGIFPTNLYLYRGKSYDWCACGHTQNAPFCDGQCKWLISRLRPVQFNVSESGYYKLCNCKMSANAPFCNSTHKTMVKWNHKHHRGFLNVWGMGVYWTCIAYWMFTFYKWEFQSSFFALDFHYSIYQLHYFQFSISSFDFSYLGSCLHDFIRSLLMRFDSEYELYWVSTIRS